jgi:hypothetical protein
LWRESSRIKPVIPAKAGIVRLRACMVSEEEVLVRHALSGL